MKGKIVILGILAAVVVSGSASPAYAKRGFLEALLPGIFGKKDDGPKPEETLIAPFAYQPPNLETDVESKDSIGSLNAAHRGAREVGDWLMQAMSESMTFEGENYQEGMTKTAVNFDEAAWREFHAFLQESGIVQAQQSQKYNIRSFMQRPPLLLNEAAVEGRYRWLFEATLMTSYMDRGVENYKKKASPVNQTINITVQVGRSKDAKNEHGVLIESWKGKVQKLDKK